MKKLFFALALMLAVFTSQAQVTGPKLAPTGSAVSAIGNLRSAPTHAVIDTITNAVTKYQYGIIGGPNQHATFQATFTKISGTAAATATLQGSNDGVLYNTVPGQSAYTVTDVSSQSCVWVVAPSSFQFYRLQVVPTGTQSVKLATTALVRKN